MNGCERSYLSKILEIGMILYVKIERKVHVNQQNFGSDIQLLIKHLFLLTFLHKLLNDYYNLTCLPSPIAVSAYFVFWQ